LEWKKLVLALLVLALLEWFGMEEFDSSLTVMAGNGGSQLWLNWSGSTAHLLKITKHKFNNFVEKIKWKNKNTRASLDQLVTSSQLEPT
jgi:hypothetical protein